MPGRRTRILASIAAIVLATAVWLPALRLIFDPDPDAFFSGGALPPRARLLAERHLRMWRDPDLRRGEIERMRIRNAEWDFMGRSFFVWSLANLAIREPARAPECVEVMDAIIGETIRIEDEGGVHAFLMPYGRSGRFVQSAPGEPPRSHFIDGEIALMLGMRRLVEEREDYRAPLRIRIDRMVARMRASPVLSGESYPDECWTFCNTVGLAALRVADVLDGTDRADLIRAWIATAKERLIEPATGLLVSAYTVSGRTIYGPEGSTIWMAAHCLALVDEAFAADQYARAKREIGRTFLGFAYAREWPPACPGGMDIDSGVVIPVLGISASSSGLAFVAAATFEDRPFLEGLLASLSLGGFPIERDGTLAYAASNPVGDAVLLYAMTLGPIWRRVKERGRP
ncbi:MAG: hypothetical protein JXP34_00975 [Planctomycetes bacterium]|nr:hypothetical protein [Planctomycetota bacterium]